MKRNEFILRSALGSVAGIALSASANARTTSTYDKLLEPIGFNHIPNKEYKSMNSVLHQAATRGHADHGWLKSHHTFSFANYYNPERTHFGVLRVLNDDSVAKGMGFGKHPHDNMEIISIPLEGDLEHKDSMGNLAVIREGDIQVMSAGTGVSHSEFNRSTDMEVKFLQIWIFPNKKNVKPRYDQRPIREMAKQNEFYQILSPDPDDSGVWIHQDAWFHMGEFDAGTTIDYQLKKAGNGVYVFIIDGDVSVNDQPLNKRDGYGIWDVSEITFTSINKSRVLLMEVPMQIG
jgi:redox-sensitive bicupin YhaK (pirin superfamily)